MIIYIIELNKNPKNQLIKMKIGVTLKNNYKSMVAIACLMPSSGCSRSLYSKSLPWTL
jgi:hypothetical protein